MEQNICISKYNPSPIFKIVNLIESNKKEVYVFIGKNIDSECKTVLSNIEKNKSPSDIDIRKLEGNFGSKFNINLGLNLTYEKINFIYDTINLDDTVSIIKKKILININLLTKHIHLWVKTTYPITKNVKENIYKKMTNNLTIKITWGDIIQKFSKFLYKNDIDFSSKKIDEFVDKSEFIKDKTIDKYLVEFSQPIDKITRDSGNLITYEINPFKCTNLINDLWINNQGNQILTTISSETNLLEHYSTIKDKIIYMVDIKNFTKYVNTFDIEDKYKLYGIYNRFYPHLHNLSEIEDKIDSDKIDEYRQILNRTQRLTDLINEKYNFSTRELTYTCGVKKFIISVSEKNKNIEIGLNRLFNIFKLSDNINFLTPQV